MKLIYLILIGALIMNSCKNKSSVREPVTFILPHIHYDYPWDPTNCSSLWMLHIYYNIADTLITFSANEKYVASVAENWTISKDKKTIQFTLSDNYRFHDGTKVSYEDIYHSIERSLLKQKTSHSDLSGALCFNENKCEGLSLKGNVLTLNLKNNINGIIFNFGIPEYSILPKPVYEGKVKGRDILFNMTGPYKIESFTQKEMVLHKHAGHRALKPTSPDTAKIIEISDFDESLKFLKQHTEAVLMTVFYGRSLEAYNLDNVKKYVSTPGFTEFMVPNIDSPRFDSKEKRNRFASIINLIKPELGINENIAEFTKQLFTKENIARIDDSQINKIFLKNPKKYSPEEDITLLVIDTMASKQLLERFKELLKKYGVNLTVNIKPRDEAFKNIQDNKYDLLYIGTGVGAFEPIIELTYLFGMDFLMKFSKNNEASINKLSKAKNTTDRDEYVRLVKEILLSLLSESRMIPLMHTRIVLASGGAYELTEFNNYDGDLNIAAWKKAGE